MKKSLTQHAKKEIKEIHALSRQYNAKDKTHSEVLIKLIRKHAKEIEQLFKKRDRHFSVEVGDLVVLCHELLLEHRKNPDEIMELCYARYKKKLTGLLNSEKQI
jgi:hypothetical protein